MSANTPAEGKYLYCLIRADAAREFASRGIGERGDPVYSIVGAGGLAAVVSDSPIVEYEGSRRNMMAHTRVLEEVMQEHTVLPVRFGVVAPDAAAIARQLAGARAAELISIIDSLDGKIELGLKAFWFEEVIFAEIVAQNAQVRQLRDSLAGRSAEETYYERIRLGELIEGEMAARRAADAEAILAALRPLVDDLRVNQVITDRMVLNAAFLLGREREPQFDAAVNALDAAMGKRIMFKYVGPVPAYNFVTITIGWG
jgi:hypothetical protein